MKRWIRMLSHGALPFVAGALIGAMALPAIGVAAWQPTKPVEVIVPAGAGGASDRMARTIQGIVTKYQLMKAPMMIMNKGGASGDEGIMDGKAAKGDAHKLIVAFSLIYTLPVATDLPFNWRDLNPVAMIAMDEFLLWVNSEAPYKTATEYLNAVKAAPSGTFKMGKHKSPNSGTYAFLRGILWQDGLQYFQERRPACFSILLAVWHEL